MQEMPTDTLEEGLDIREYLALLWQWAWLIAIITLIAGAAAYYFSSRMTPYYQANTTVLVNEARGTQSMDISSVALSERLTSTYSEMIIKEPVLAAVIDRLGLSLSSSALRGMITVKPVSDTQLIKVSVESTDPAAAAAIANSLVQVFSEQILDIQSNRFAQSKISLETQLTDIEKQIEKYTNASAQASSTAEKEDLDSKIAQYRGIYANLLQSYEQVRLSEAQTTSSVTQIEAATAPTAPIRPDIFKNTLQAALVGMVLAVGFVIAREVLDDTIKTPEEVTRQLGLPVLGVINHHPIKEGTLITEAEPRSPTAEAFRKLRTNVGFASIDRPLETLLVTSAEPGEGKTTVISNLAVVIAQNGHSVTLLDCDLRHPTVHRRFGLTNRQGISRLFFQPNEQLNGSCQATRVENLSVLTTGQLPPNPAELLGSQRMQSILGMVREKTDMVLIDTPPTLAVTDASVLAPAVDGVLLVVRPGKTHASAARQTVEQLRRVNARLLGVVLNNLDMRGSRYSYRYHYYRDYSAYQHYYGVKSRGSEKNAKSTQD
jgi:non-specific protein-tyrosine kinase